MWNTFKYTLLWLVRSPGILVWSLLFPLVLSTVFMLMFGPLEEMGQLEPLRVAVVQPNDTPEGEAFESFIDAMDEGDDRLLDVTMVASEDEAARLVRDSAGEDDGYVGYVVLDGAQPRVSVAAGSSLSDTDDLNGSVLVLIMDEYTSRASLVRDLIERDPAVLADPTVMASLFEPVRATVQVQVTEGQPKESTRFYYAMLGMTALFGGNAGLAACVRLKGNSSALGARRSIGATSHRAAIAATLLASWALSFCCLAITYAYMRYVGGVDFGPNDAACLAVVAAASLVAISLGCAISAIPHVPEEGKNGILTGIVCFASLFAGLYGQPTMELADTIAAAFPPATWVNPATQVAQAFYSIMYYDTAAPLLEHLAILAAMAVVLFLLSARSLRRQRYASI